MHVAPVTLKQVEQLESKIQVKEHLEYAVNADNSDSCAGGNFANKVSVYNESHVLWQLSCGYLLWPFLHCAQSCCSHSMHKQKLQSSASACKVNLFTAGMASFGESLTLLLSNTDSTSDVTKSLYALGALSCEAVRSKLHNVQGLHRLQVRVDFDLELELLLVHVLGLVWHDDKWVLTTCVALASHCGCITGPGNHGAPVPWLACH